ncbi:MAG: hypothetical protein JNJ77_17580 [Planctomycetia bacterium]|nr:hypothetical protein [Planctomycetia bacterium]
MFNFIKQPMIILMLALHLSGCASESETDISNASEYNFRQFSGTSWKTKVKTAVAEMKDYKGNSRLCLLPPVFYDKTHPTYTSQTRIERIIEEMPIGTRLKIARLLKDNGKAGLITITAKLEDGREVIVVRQC